MKSAEFFGFLARFFDSVGVGRRDLARPRRVSKHVKGRQKSRGWWAKRKARLRMTKRSRRINRGR